MNRTAPQPPADSAETAIPASPTPVDARAVRGRIRSISGLNRPVVLVWVETADGRPVPVRFEEGAFWQLAFERGAENLAGSAVSVEIEADGAGDGRSLRFDDGRGNQP